ncbi:hypothetical protein Bca4012_080006 [Brassica carinata]
MGLVAMLYGLLKSVQIDKNDRGTSFSFEISHYVFTTANSVSGRRSGLPQPPSVQWGYWLRVVVLSAWLSRMRSRVDRLMLSEIEAKTWKTNEMVVLDFFNPMFGGLMALMRYRY